MIYTTTLRIPAWIMSHLLQRGAGCWKEGFGVQTQGEDSSWLWNDSLKGQEQGVPQLGKSVETAWDTIAKRHCREACKGPNRLYNPLPHLLASSASVGIGKGSHLNGPTRPLVQGRLCQHRLWEPECRPSQNLLENQPWAPLPGMRVHWSWQGWRAKAWGWKDRPRERSTVVCRDTIEGTEVRGPTTRNSLRGSLVCLESKAPLLRGVWGDGTDNAPICQLVLLQALGVPKCVPSSHCFHSLTSGRVSDAWGWHTHRGEVKTKIEPEGVVQLRKRNTNLSMQQHKLWIKSLRSAV